MPKNHAIKTVLLTIFLDLVGFGMVLPILPMYASDPRFHATPGEVGWLMAIYSLCQFVFSPLWGWLSDRWGRRPILLVGLLGSTISYLVYGLAESLTVLFISRAIAGLMGANIAVANAVVADLTPPERRAQGMGLVGMAFSLGFILGPSLGGLAAQYGIHTPPLIAAAITGLNFLAAVWFLPETITESTKLREFTHPLLREIAGEPGPFKLSLVMGGFITLFGAFEVVLPLYGVSEFALGMEDMGWLFAFIGVMMAFTQGGVVRRMVPRLGEKFTATLGLAFTSLGMLGLYLAPGVGMLLVALGFMACGAGLIHPAFSSLVSLNSPTDHQGTALGRFHSLAALGRVVGPLLGGFGFELAAGKLFVLLTGGMVITLMVFRSLTVLLRDAREFPRS